MASDQDERDLSDLIHHWGDAYTIAHTGPDTWLAQRKDKSLAVLSAQTPAELLEKIRADYAARPVPRSGTVSE